MDAAGSITSLPPVHDGVAKEFWYICLTSRLLASFLGDASDLYYLSTCCRAFVPFRTQIWRVMHMHRHQEHSTLSKAISSGRLPCLRVLDLDLFSTLIFVFKKEIPPILTLVIAGQVPSLRELRLRVWSVLDDAVPSMLRLMALSHLECLHLDCGWHHSDAVKNSIRNAAKKYPRLTLHIE